MFNRTLRTLIRMSVGTGALLWLMGPSLAEPSQSAPIQLGLANAPSPKVVRGFTRGSVALFKTVGDRDANNRRCMGYGSLQPDHVVEVKDNLKQLSLQVGTSGLDTTLLVKGPGDRLLCADDALNGGKDAGLKLENVKPGTYQVWVGAFEPGDKFKYTLTLSPQ